MYLVRKKCRSYVNVNKDKDIYSCFVLIVCDFRVFRRHGICDSSNKIQMKWDQIRGTSGVQNMSLQHNYNNNNNIIIFYIINFNCVVTGFHWLFYMYTNMR